MTAYRDRELENLNEQNRNAWETRSKLLRTSLKSVPFKGLPDVVNEHLHNWHKNLILNTIEDKHNLRMLDVGCEYGRLSMAIIERLPDEISLLPTWNDGEINSLCRRECMLFYDQHNLQEKAAF